MKRPIKFRGLRLDNGEWVHGCLYWHLTPQNETYCWINEQKDNIHNLVWLRVMPNTVGQFTGLHDKNGKEIYEGDILQFENNIVYVEFDNTGARFSLYDKIDRSNPTKYNPSWDFHDGMSSHCEIIGNIYENPDL